ncbi:MAG: M36 family metallopeptidase, partial [Terriglobales bacterium]
ANFSTPSDGFNPTMNMFLWDGLGCWQQNVDGDSTQDLDGDLDLDIVMHEYHHGVSHRLNTSFSGNEAGAMGEGGGDFFAYSVDGDTKLAEYSRPPNGIRQVNTKTYGNWACSPSSCSVHSNGQIWANTLWDLRERVRTDLAGGSQQTGINEVHQLYINGLKLSPNSPTMLEMRDSMLQDDLIRHPSPDPGGSANYCRMWDEFAGRGMGVNALDTKDTGSSSSVLQDFAVPVACGGPPPTPPAPPSGLAATAVSFTQINLAWTDGSGNEDGFRIERCPGGLAVCDANPVNYTQIAQVVANSTSYSDTGLAASTPYSYRIRAFNAAGNSAYSASDDATTLAAPALPDAPTNLLATGGSAGNSRFVDLVWNDNSSNETSFRIERCQVNKQGVCNFAEVASTAANGSATATFRDNTVTRRKTYRYRVRARNAAGDSGYSNQVQVTTP